MDNQALAEQMTDVYTYIESHYEKKTSGKPTAEQTNTIFIECAKIIMTEMINKARPGVPPKQESTGDSKPSEKQIAFAKKLGCHNPEGFSKYELSQWIDENKKF